MNRFVKLMLCVMALCLVFTLCACGNDNGKAADSTGETTEASTGEIQESTDAQDGKVTYTVTVVDEGGNPVVGAFVQLCLDTCFPGATDASGVATFMQKEADYKVSFVSLPTGYEADAEEFYFEKGSYDMTITLKAVA